MSFLVMEGEEHSYIWESICEMQLIFHPKYSREGEVDHIALLDLRNYKKIIILLDRNLLSSLLNLSRYGNLKDEEEMRIIAVLMTWMIMNNFPASAGLALKEHATKFNSVTEPKMELTEFNN